MNLVPGKKNNYRKTVSTSFRRRVIAFVIDIFRDQYAVYGRVHPREKKDAGATVVIRLKTRVSMETSKKEHSIDYGIPHPVCRRRRTQKTAIL